MLGKLPAPDLENFWNQLDDTCYRVSEKYQKSAPAVAEWAEFLLDRRNKPPLTWNEIKFVVELDIEEIHPNLAQNMLYKLKYRLGQDTTGLSDY